MLGASEAQHGKGKEMEAMSDDKTLDLELDAKIRVWEALRQAEIGTWLNRNSQILAKLRKEA